MSEKKLIAAVKPYRMLYDLFHPDYKNIRLKEHIWEMIAQKIGHQSRGGRATRDAWLKLRACHRDALRRQKKYKPARPWRFSKQMEFLIKHMTNRGGSTSYENIQIDAQNSSEYSEDDSDIRSLALENVNVRLEVENKSIDCISPIWRKDTSDDEPEQVSIIDVVDQNDANKMSNNNSENEEDPMYHFFMTMYAMTSKLTPAVQHNVKKEIFSIVTKAEEDVLFSCSKSDS